MNSMKCIPCIALALLFLLACSEPSSPPEVIPPLEPPEDTTSHAYSWEFHIVGVWGGSVLRAVAADADSSVWAVGYIQLDSTILSIPTGRESSTANAIRITPEAIVPYAIGVPSKNGQIAPAELYGITVERGYPTFWVTRRWTKMLPEGWTHAFFEDLNGLIIGREFFERGREGDVYLYGGRGFLGRFDGPSHKTHTQFPTGTARTITAFAEVGPDEFYVGGWDHDTTNGTFHHIKAGVVTDMQRDLGNGVRLNHATALWASRERLFAFCPPYLYIQSLRQPQRWDTLFLPPEIAGMNVGLPVCANGREDNDAFIAGHNATIIHYNGRSLHFYDEVQAYFGHGVFEDIAVTPRKVYIVGSRNNRAILAIGTRRD